MKAVALLVAVSVCMYCTRRRVLAMVHHGRCCRLAVSASEHVAASEWGSLLPCRFVASLRLGLSITLQRGPTLVLGSDDDEFAC